VGMYSGHTHMDDFRVLTDSKGTPYLVDHITPAVSPVRNNNPGFQMFRYDRKTGKVLDMATYFDDLTAAAPTWGLEYTFNAAYGLDGYNGENLLKLSNSIFTNAAIRKKYILYVPVSSTHEVPINANDWKYFCCAETQMDDVSYQTCHQ
jgi:hypothetical protein